MHMRNLRVPTNFLSVMQLVEEKHSRFAGRECLNYHPNNVGLIRAHGYTVSESVPGFEIKAAHAVRSTALPCMNLELSNTKSVRTWDDSQTQTTLPTPLL